MNTVFKMNEIRLGKLFEMFSSRQEIQKNDSLMITRFFQVILKVLRK